MNDQNNAPQLPSLHGLRCPHCGATEYKVIGVKGGKGKAVGIGMAFGAIGNLIASAASKGDLTAEPVQYKCASCGKKFDTYPLTAGPEELLEAPCTVNFHRLSSFVGMAVTQQVWLNGVKVASVGNGKMVTFQTFTRHNTIFVTDQYGVAFKGHFTFEAQPGGTVDVRFKRKFQ